MSRKHDLVGSLIFMLAIAGFFLSTHIVDAKFVPDNDDHPQSSHPVATTEPKTPARVSPETFTKASAGRYCLDKDGNAYDWNYANVPFAALACNGAPDRSGK
jgi:hypothetical protein